jgi:hypothetical protein
MGMRDRSLEKTPVTSRLSGSEATLVNRLAGYFLPRILSVNKLSQFIPALVSHIHLLLHHKLAKEGQDFKGRA